MRLCVCVCVLPVPLHYGASDELTRPATGYPPEVLTSGNGLGVGGLSRCAARDGTRHFDRRLVSGWLPASVSPRARMPYPAGCTASVHSSVRWALCACSVGSRERVRGEWHLGPDIR